MLSKRGSVGSEQVTKDGSFRQSIRVKYFNAQVNVARTFELTSIWLNGIQ